MAIVGLPAEVEDKAVESLCMCPQTGFAAALKESADIQRDAHKRFCHPAFLLSSIQELLHVCWASMLLLKYSVSNQHIV